jgi:hypothetical protein
MLFAPEFRRETHDLEGFDRLLETLAAAGDYLAAKAAYEAAVNRRPGGGESSPRRAMQPCESRKMADRPMGDPAQQECFRPSFRFPHNLGA